MNFVKSIIINKSKHLLNTSILMNLSMERYGLKKNLIEFGICYMKCIGINI